MILTPAQIIEYVVSEGVLPMLMIVLAIYFVYTSIRKASRFI